MEKSADPTEVHKEAVGLDSHHVALHQLAHLELREFRSGGSPLLREYKLSGLGIDLKKCDAEGLAHQGFVVFAVLQLRAGNDSRVFVYLRGDFERIGRRLAERRGHYMPAGLLESQFADLEEPGPDEAIVVDIDVSAGEVGALLRSREAGESG